MPASPKETSLKSLFEKEHTIQAPPGFEDPTRVRAHTHTLPPPAASGQWPPTEEGVERNWWAESLKSSPMISCVAEPICRLRLQISFILRLSLICITIWGLSLINSASSFLCLPCSYFLWQISCNPECQLPKETINTVEELVTFRLRCPFLPLPSSLVLRRSSCSDSKPVHQPTSILHRALLSRISLVNFTAFHEGLTEVTVILQPGVQFLKPLPRFPIKYLSLQQVRMNSHSEIILTLKTHNKGLGWRLSGGACA